MGCCHKKKKSLNTVQAQVFGAANKVIVNLESMAEEEHLVVGFEKEKVVTPKVEVKKTRMKMAPQEVVKEAKKGQKNLSSSEFCLSLSSCSNMKPQLEK